MHVINCQKIQDFQWIQVILVAMGLMCLPLQAAALTLTLTIGNQEGELVCDLNDNPNPSYPTFNCIKNNFRLTLPLQTILEAVAQVDLKLNNEVYWIDPNTSTEVELRLIPDQDATEKHPANVSILTISKRNTDSIECQTNQSFPPLSATGDYNWHCDDIQFNFQYVPGWLLVTLLNNRPIRHQDGSELRVKLENGVLELYDPSQDGSPNDEIDNETKIQIQAKTIEKSLFFDAPETPLNVVNEVLDNFPPNDRQNARLEYNDFKCDPTFEVYAIPTIKNGSDQIQDIYYDPVERPGNNGSASVECTGSYTLSLSGYEPVTDQFILNLSEQQQALPPGNNCDTNQGCLGQVRGTDGQYRYVTEAEERDGLMETIYFPTYEAYLQNQPGARIIQSEYGGETTWGCGPEDEPIIASRAACSYYLSRSLKDNVTYVKRLTVQSEQMPYSPFDLETAPVGDTHRAYELVMSQTPVMPSSRDDHPEECWAVGYDDGIEGFSRSYMDARRCVEALGGWSNLSGKPLYLVLQAVNNPQCSAENRCRVYVVAW